MENPAPADHDLHDLIKRRWSPRAFADRPVPPALLRSLFEAARWAASCFNAQPWRYIVTTRDGGVAGADAHARLVSCLVPKNQDWAKDAPVLMLSVARTTFEHNDQPNRHALHDVGAASAQLTAQATALGLAVHQMAGFDRDKARQAFGIPAPFEPVAAIALGYPGEPDALPQDLRDREVSPRTRKPQSELVFAGTWDNSFDA